MRRNPLLEVLFVLIPVLILFGLYSFYKDSIRLGDFSFDKSSIASFLTYQEIIESEIEKDTVPVLTVKETQLPDSTKHKVLLVGDSMVQELELAFAPLFSRNHFDFRSIAIQSSTITTYANGDTILKAVEEFDPTLVMISLGSNELLIQNPKSLQPKLKQIFDQIGDRKIVWIGPPNWRKDKGINDFLEKEVGKDQFFSSKDLLFERKKDGIHPTAKACVYWADTINSWLMYSSKYQIVTDRSFDDSVSVKILADVMQNIANARRKNLLKQKNFRKSSADSINSSASKNEELKEILIDPSKQYHKSNSDTSKL